LDTYNSLLSSPHPDLFIHIGDISYADDYFLRPEFLYLDTYENTWDMWQQWMMPLTSVVPYMVLPGNHEAACQEFLTYMVCPSYQTNFTTYQNRFRMPSQESGAGDVGNMWSSFDYGMVHFVMIDTETDFPNAPEGPNTTLASGPFGGGVNPAQLTWLQNDLQAANENRSSIPWIVVLGHRPAYTGSTFGGGSVDNFSPVVQNVFSPIFEQYGVDLYISGHLHFYERMYPIAAGVPEKYSGQVYTNPRAPVYVVNGAAGNDERLTQVTEYNYTLGAYFDNADYGYGQIIVHNSSHLQWQYIITNNDSIVDQLWLVQDRSAGFGHVSSSHALVASWLMAIVSCLMLVL